MPSSNRLVIAAAGSGKTTLITNEAVERAKRGNRVLITTFTQACEREIRDKLVQTCGSIPQHITVLTWFSFLITHGIKPFQGRLFSYDVSGMILVNGRSGFRYRLPSGQPVYFGESDFDRYYFAPDKRVYSDKAALLTLRCDDASDGRVFARIARCFHHTYVDEVQDLAGYDLEVLDRLIGSPTRLTLVGDPRQATYSTHATRKNRKYRKGNIVNFFQDNELDIDTDDQSLSINYRCTQSICDLSNSLYPALPKTKSGNTTLTSHDGVFLVPENLVADYLAQYRPIQLRENVKRQVDQTYPVMNFGKSKGLTFDRVLIYASQPMTKWLKDRKHAISQAARSKLYVALTRARFSVGIVLSSEDIAAIGDLPVYAAEPGRHTKSGNSALTEFHDWSFDMRTIQDKFQAIACRKSKHGIYLRIYGCIDSTPKAAILSTVKNLAKSLAKYERL